MSEQIKEQESLHHTTTVENLDGLFRKVNVTIDADGVRLAINQATEVVAKKVQIHGYRKGKAPHKLVEKMCYDEVKNVAIFMLTQSGFARACHEQNLTPLNQPKVEKADIRIDGTFGCEITLEVKPTIVPTGYVGMALKRTKIDPESMFNQKLEDLMEYHVVKEARKEVQDGYEVTLDFWVLVGEKQISEGKDQVFTIKKSQEPPFGENLIGAKMGEMQSATITLPDNYPEYGGQQAVVKMDVKLVVEKIRPTNEQLVEKMEAPSYEELMSVVRADVEKTLQQQERSVLEEQVVDKLINMHDFLVPESWVADETKYLSNQIQMSNPDDEVMKTFRQLAERNVKRTFLIESIYGVESSLQVTEEEIEAFIKKEADRLNTSTLNLKSELKKQNMFDGVIGLIKNNKVMDFIIANAQIEDEEACSHDECACGDCSCEHSHITE